MMSEQTLTLAGRRFVVLPERDYLKLRQLASKATEKRTPTRQVNSKFAQDAMQALHIYRKTRKAAKWSDVKAKLGLSRAPAPESHEHAKQSPRMHRQMRDRDIL